MSDGLKSNVNPLMDGGYLMRKNRRTQEFNRRCGVKQVTCGACSGSGYYDDTGSPKCSACSGTGKIFNY